MAERDWLETERYTVAVGEPLKRMMDVLHEAGQVPFLWGAGHRQNLRRPRVGERTGLEPRPRPFANDGAV
jgi:hypothetical protein